MIIQQLKKIFKYGIMAVLPMLLSACSVFRPAVHDTHVHDAKNKELPVKVTNTNSKTAPIKIDHMLSTARAYLGVPYKAGGYTTDGFDCSGLIYNLGQTEGVFLPRISAEQAAYGILVPFENLQKGDLLFFDTTRKNGAINHVGIVTEVVWPQKLKFIHASTSRGVVEENFFIDYWKKSFIKAKRPFVF